MLRRTLPKCRVVSSIWSTQQQQPSQFVERAIALKRQYRGRGLSTIAKTSALTLLQEYHVPVLPMDTSAQVCSSSSSSSSSNTTGNNAAREAPPFSSTITTTTTAAPVGAAVEATAASSALEAFCVQNGVALVQLVLFFEIDLPSRVFDVLLSALSKATRHALTPFEDRLDAAIQQVRLCTMHTRRDAAGLGAVAQQQRRSDVAQRVYQELSEGNEAAWPTPRTLHQIEAMGQLMQRIHHDIDPALMATLVHRFVSALCLYMEDHRATVLSVSGVRTFAACCRVAPDHPATAAIKAALLRTVENQPRDFTWELPMVVLSMHHLQAKVQGALSADEYLCLLRGLAQRERCPARDWATLLQTIGAWHRPGPTQVTVTDPAQRAESDRLVLNIATNAASDVTRNITHYHSGRSEMASNILNALFQLELDGIHRHPAVFPGALSVLLERLYVAPPVEGGGSIADQERRALLPLVCGMVSRIGAQRFSASIRRALVDVVEQAMRLGDLSASGIAHVAASFVHAQGSHATTLRWWSAAERAVTAQMEASLNEDKDVGASGTADAADGPPMSAYAEALLCVMFGGGGGVDGGPTATLRHEWAKTFLTNTTRWQELTPRHVCEVYAIACRLGPSPQLSVAEALVCGVLQQSMPGCVRADEVETLCLVQSSHSRAVQEALDQYLLRCASEDGADWNAELLLLLPHMRAHSKRRRTDQQPQDLAWSIVTESVLADKALMAAKRLSRSATSFVFCARFLAQQYPQGVDAGARAGNEVAATASSRALFAFITNGGDDLLDRATRTPPEWIARYVLALHGTKYAVGTAFLRSFVDGAKNVRKSVGRVEEMAAAGSLLVLGNQASRCAVAPELLRELLTNLVASMSNCAAHAHTDDPKATHFQWKAMRALAQFQHDAMSTGVVSEPILKRNASVVQELQRRLQAAGSRDQWAPVLDLLPVAGVSAVRRPMGLASEGPRASTIERDGMTSVDLSMEDDGMALPPVPPPPAPCAHEPAAVASPLLLKEVKSIEEEAVVPPLPSGPSMGDSAVREGSEPVSTQAAAPQSAATVSPPSATRRSNVTKRSGNATTHAQRPRASKPSTLQQKAPTAKQSSTSRQTHQASSKKKSFISKPKKSTRVAKTSRKGSLPTRTAKAAPVQKKSKKVLPRK